MDLVAGIQNQEVRAIARAMSMIERRDPGAQALMEALAPNMGKAHVIGITGSPGSGKSTLTDQLIAHYRRQGKRVGVIAVDPSSPFTGGAILGDRIRMQKRTTDPGVYIRSMGTRGNLGGLSSGTAECVRILDAAGYEIVIVETVGVGQAEVDVVRLADTVVVVLVPGLGDDIQAVKAGVMEIADVFCINKADLIGADKVEAEVDAMMALGHPDTDDFWWQPVRRTIAERGTGIPELAKSLEDHHAWAVRTGALTGRRRKRFLHQVKDLLGRAVVDFAMKDDGEPLPTHVELFDEGLAGKGPLWTANHLLQLYRQS